MAAVGDSFWSFVATPSDFFSSLLKELGIRAPLPPSAAATDVNTVRNLWVGAGLKSVEAREIEVQRTFPSFEAYWTSIMMVTLRPVLAGMAPEVVEQLKVRVRDKVLTGSDGAVTGHGRASAVKGRVAG